MSLVIVNIILISLMNNVITATIDCANQLSQYRLVTKTLNQECPLVTTNIATCCDLNAYHIPESAPAIYKIDCCWCDAPFQAAKVYCDTCDKWTVIQRRMDGSENFHRPWVDYENGFGDLNGEFWYGLKALHCLTTQKSQWELRIDFKFQNGTRSYMHYSQFSVGNAANEYPLTVNSFTGITPDDPFSGHSGFRFSTYDNDNDDWNNNCAAQNANAFDNGGWWFHSCWNIALNIRYYPGQFGFIRFHDTWYNPRWIEMKMRPRNCITQ